MWFKIVMEGNAFYEIDEECMRKKEQKEKQEEISKKKQK